MDVNAAATIIQSKFKSFRQQRGYLKLRHATLVLQDAWRNCLFKKQLKLQKIKEDRKKRFENVMKRHQQKIQMRTQHVEELKNLSGKDYEKWIQNRSSAAIRIQTMWKGFKIRNKFKKIIKESSQEGKITKKSQLLQENIIQNQKEKNDKEKFNVRESQISVFKNQDPCNSVTSNQTNISAEELRKKDEYLQTILEQIDNKSQEIIQSEILNNQRIQNIQKQWKYQETQFFGLKRRIEVDTNELHDARRQARAAYKKLQTMPQNLSDLNNSIKSSKNLDNLNQLNNIDLIPSNSQRAERAFQAHALCKIECSNYYECWKPLKVLNEIVVPNLKKGLVEFWDERDQLRTERWDALKQIHKQSNIQSSK